MRITWSKLYSQKRLLALDFVKFKSRYRQGREVKKQSSLTRRRAPSPPQQTQARPLPPNSRATNEAAPVSVVSVDSRSLQLRLRPSGLSRPSGPSSQPLPSQPSGPAPLRQVGADLRAPRSRKLSAKRGGPHGGTSAMPFFFSSAACFASRSAARCCIASASVARGSILTIA